MSEKKQPLLPDGGFTERNRGYVTKTAKTSTEKHEPRSKPPHPSNAKSTDESAFAAMPEISPIEEPMPPQSNAGEVLRVGKSSQAGAAVSAAGSLVLQAAPELSPIEEPIPSQARGGGVERLGGDRHARRRSQQDEGGGIASLTDTINVVQNHEQDVAHREDMRRIDLTALPGTHRMYPTSVDSSNAESDSVSSETSGNSTNIETMARDDIVPGLDGTPIVGFIPHESRPSDTDGSTLVERVRNYLQEHAAVADVIATDETKETKTNTLSLGWHRRHLRLIIIIIIILLAAAIVAPTAMKLSSEKSEGSPPTVSEGNDPSVLPSSPPTNDPSLYPSGHPSGQPSKFPSISTAPSLFPTISAAPTSNEWSQLKTILIGMNASEEGVFSDAFSPQSRAFHWLAEEDFITSGDSQSSLLARNETSRILVRYALAVLYFSTGGKESWRNQYSFISGNKHECLWNRPYECIEDYPTDWVDAVGRDCAWYAEGSNCEENGVNVGKFGYAANEACCICKVKHFAYNMGVYCAPSDIGDPIVIEIVLEDNFLWGTLPYRELGLLKDLERIWMTLNMLRGEMPPDIGRLRHLQVLDMRNNELTGTIPSSIEKLDELKFLSLSQNALTGTVPRELGNMSSLVGLSLNINQLTGTIPSSLGKLVNLEILWLSANHLNGTIPPSIGNMTNLWYINLHSNQLRGEIPYAINQMDKLEELFFDFNTLTGHIPLMEGGLMSLKRFSISGNSLTGSIPSQIVTISSLEELDVSYNILTGTIPTNLAGLGSLGSLLIASNNITGTLPPSLVGSSSLQVIDVSANEISGTINSFIGQSLSWFEAYSNILTGSIPPELGKHPSLEVLELGGNQLTGSVPSEFGGSPRLYLFNVSYNFLNGTVPATFVDLVNREDPWGFDYLLLHNNQLSGNISFLCENNNKRLLIFADCAGPSLEVECSCCNICCDRDGNCDPK